MEKLVFMGTPDFAAGILSALLSSDFSVSAVFTQPDKPKGRGKNMQKSPVKELAERAEIPVYQPVKIRTEENVSLLREIKPEFIVVAAFGQIIPQSILDIPAYGCINVHASLLPAWRGAAPIQWSILNGDRSSGVTIMRMNAGLDTGDIIDRVEVPIEPDETGESLTDKLMEAGKGLLLESMKRLIEGKASFTPQPERSSTPYASMLKKEMGLIDWTMPAEMIERQVRALTPWPSAYSYEHGKMLKIWKAEALKDLSEKSLPPGSIRALSKTSLLVQTGEGVLSLLEVQPEGKKRMTIDAFLRGYRQKEGEVLGQRA